MKCSLGFSNFLEGSSSLSHSVVFIYFFALVTEGVSLAILWNSAFKWVYLSFPPLPFTSWKIVGETVEIVADFIFGGSKITADGDCSHEIRRCLLLGRKVMTNLDSILKNRDITLPTMVHLLKAMVFPLVMYGYESWNTKKAECCRINAFELWCWKRLLRALGLQADPTSPS